LVKRIWNRFYENREILIEAKHLPRNLSSMAPRERDLYRKLHETIQGVTTDMEGAFHFNSAIARIMELFNAIDDCGVAADSPDQQKAVYYVALENLIILLSPFAPHVCEELWAELGNSQSILRARWPEVDKAALARDEVEIVIQVNGKVRGRISVPSSLSGKDLEAQVVASEQVRKYTEGKTIRKVIVVPGKLVNIAVS